MRCAFATCVVLLLLGAWCVAEDATELPKRLDDVQYIESFVGSKAARQRLAEQGFVVTHQQFPQIFAAYLKLEESKPWLPNFITVDSAWHAYHVMLEDGVQALEQRQAGSLLRFSRCLLETARAKSTKSGDAYWDLAAFAAIGLGLQDESAITSLPDDLRGVVTNFRSQVESGGGLGNILFFGLPMAGERLRVVSFYTQSPQLRGYFIARQWYGACCFRLRDSVETQRAIQLALLIDQDEQLQQLYKQLTVPYDSLLGPPDDATVPQYAQAASAVMGQAPSADQIAQGLEEFRALASQFPRPRVNDQLLAPEQFARYAEETCGFRLLPMRRCPSAVILQRTSHPLVEGRMLPSGLDFFAVGPLTCESGRRALQALVGSEDTREAILSAEPEPIPDSLHGEALSLLGSLQSPLPQSVPGPLRTNAWQDKQLWTSLGAWSEQRHTWAGHIKLSITVLDGEPQPPGYVSPYPQFFRDLGTLARRTADVLLETRTDPDPKVVGQEVLDALDLEEQAMSGRSPSDHRLSTMRERLWILYSSIEKDERDRGPGQTETLTALARRWIDSTDLDPTDWELIRQWAKPAERDPTKLLPAFAKMCDRLAEIAQKQIDAQPLDDEDAALIRGYGALLAKFHFYGSYAWMYPQDDFPLVSPVFANPQTAEILYAGIGRPEALYVVLPVDGQWVLHRGAVLSYREFPRRPSSETVNDETWMTEVKAGKTPPPPVFTSSFRSVTTREAAKESKRVAKAGRLGRWAESGPHEAPGNSSVALPLLIAGVVTFALLVLVVTQHAIKQSKE